MQHARNVFQCRSVTKKVKNDPTSLQEFFIVVLGGFVLYSVMSELQMASLDGDPSHNGFQDFSDKSKEERVSIYIYKAEKLSVCLSVYIPFRSFS